MRPLDVDAALELMSRRAADLNERSAVLRYTSDRRRGEIEELSRRIGRLVRALAAAGLLSMEEARELSAGIPSGEGEAAA